MMRVISCVCVWLISGAAAFAGGSPAAAEPLGAAEILGKVRDAVGYDKLAAMPSGVRAAGSASLAGMECSYELIFSGGRSCIQSISGPIPFVQAIDGETVWTRDIGGEVRRLAGADRESAELGLQMVTYAYLAADGPLEFTAPAGDGDGGASLAFVHRGGRIGGTLEIDPETWLPRRWVYEVGPRATITEMGEYIESGGVRFPSRITSHGTGSAVSVSIAGVGPAPVFMRSPYAMPKVWADDTAFDAAAPAALETVRAPTGHILVHPLIDGKDLGWFIFDTGAGNSVLSTPVAGALGLERFGSVPASGIGGRSDASFCRPGSLTLGPVTMQRPLMVVLDLSFLEQHMGRPIAGLIGYNLLARCVARIDMETPAVSLHDPSAFEEPEIAWVPLVIDQRLPHVEASFEGRTGFFRLDTGAAQMSVSMHEPAVRELGLLEGRDTVESKAGGVGGFVAVKRGTLAWFELGGRRTEDVRAEFATEAKGAFADPYSLGNIGGVLLKPFVLVTDYRGDRIAFVPRGGAPAAPPEAP